MSYIYYIKVNYSSEGSPEEKVLEYPYKTREQSLANLEDVITHGKIANLINTYCWNTELKEIKEIIFNPKKAEEFFEKLCSFPWFYPEKIYKELHNEKRKSKKFKCLWLPDNMKYLFIRDQNDSLVTERADWVDEYANTFTSAEVIQVDVAFENVLSKSESNLNQIKEFIKTL